MKKTAIVILLSLFITTFITATATATDQSAVKSVNQLAKSSMTAAAVVDGYMQAWNSHDEQKIANFYAPEVVWYDLASDTKIVGKTKVTPAIIAYFMGAVADLYWHKNGDVYISDDTVIYEWVYGGTFTGSWGQQTITNKRFSVKGISTSTVNQQGLIIAQKDYYDIDSFKRALGVTK